MVPASVVLAFLFVGLSTVICLLRLFLRLLWLRDYSPAEFVNIFVIILLGFQMCGMAITDMYGNNYMPPSVRESLTSEEKEQHILGTKWFLVGGLTYYAIVWCFRASLLLLYRPLTSNVAGYRYLLPGGLAVLGLTYLGVVLARLLSCRPIGRMWQMYPDPGKECAEALVHVYVASAFGIIIDISLIIIPMSVIWMAKMRRRDKIGLYVLFGLGFFTVAVIIVRLILTIADPAAHSAIVWATVEIFSTCIVCNAPSMRVVLVRFRRGEYPSGYLSGSRGAGTHARSQGTYHHSRPGTSWVTASGRRRSRSPTGRAAAPPEEMYVKGQINVTTDVSVDVRKTDDPETGRQPSSTGSGEGFVDDCEMRPLATHGMAKVLYMCV
ncbi:hypothetical protein T310_1597 [Rasamsonia emersonii CBS 393.64]|uniref:Rhodopsin domain-containing protein n=1 Tax=Rasamsonia emersonii (strain ATCC 16479 / CBS 393.64 / IMI 116815) TaxID=1408163 RepID=A0A0F4Z1L7_RASE3|nr:hypothetical protein T310_1597 [Rasamsonia emersonii CBS 393.64]KKA24412.1 hypothetical protein T310_1597 [Rasamsonia emersonii CBS 393.64]